MIIFLISSGYRREENSHLLLRHLPKVLFQKPSSYHPNFHLETFVLKMQIKDSGDLKKQNKTLFGSDSWPSMDNQLCSVVLCPSPNAVIQSFRWFNIYSPWYLIYISLNKSKDSLPRVQIRFYSTVVGKPKPVLDEINQICRPKQKTMYCSFFLQYFEMCKYG